MEFSRQEYWSGLPLPSPGNCPYAGIKPGSSALQADSLPCEPPGEPVYRLTLEILQVGFQPPQQSGIKIKQITEFFGFPVHMKVILYSTVVY